jgi:ATP-dependent RNA helicase RhlE
MSFSQFPLHDDLQRAIAAAGYQTPTPIQAAAIPIALAGRDVLGTAQTGTGKTAAFALPILHRLLMSPSTVRRTRVLVLTPTRELATQVQAHIQQLAGQTKLRTATVFGGVGMVPQERVLRNGTEIIVACPGRLLDHAQRGNIDFRGIECLVLDEADRMLDMGFMPAIRRIIALLPQERQTMLFSATFAPELHRFVAQTLRNPEQIAMGISAPAQTISHAIYPVPTALKTTLLTALLHGMASKAVLIFTRTKHRADRVAAHLTRAGYATGVLHANKSQSQRQQALANFRAGTVPYLVATDIAARGIDVSSVSHVINFDIPDTADTYIHRIGRTGRASRSGEALTLVTREDHDTVQSIERALGERLPTQILSGFDYQQASDADSLPEGRGGSRAGGSGGRQHPGLAYLTSTAYRETLTSACRA